MLQVHELVDCLGRDVFVLCGDIIGEEATSLPSRVDLMTQAHARGVVLDLREVDAVDVDGARAIRAIAATARSTGCPLELCNLADRLEHTLADLPNDTSH
jgi:anti-anti-sigma regulatory factor